MKRKISRILTSLIIAAFILAIPLIKGAVDTATKQPTPTPQISQNQIEFNEESYPDFYRIAGKANVEKKLKPGEIEYQKFDKEGRTLGVYANLTNTNFQYGQREREPIDDIRPSGWLKNKEVTLRFIDGTTYHGWFYNRSHLLAHSLGGDDKNYNLITGTRPQNVGKNNGEGGMQYTERKAYIYLENNKNGRVYYSAVPNYIENELVPRTVTINIKSNDGLIDQCVIVYNVAPGYAIDYATGNFTAK